MQFLIFGWNDILGIKKAFYSILLSLDALIYNLICWFYDLFIFLADLNVFNNADYENIVRRIYIVLGVIMLFILTYSLLRAVINPDEFAKGENSFANIIKNVVVSLVIITLLPTVFDVVFQVQGVILKSNVIEKLILTDSYSSSAAGRGGRTMAITTFQAFFRFNEDTVNSPDYGSDAEKIKNDLAVTFDEVERGLSFSVFNGKYTVVNGSGDELYFPELIVDGVIDYTWLISSAAGIFVLWCILLFCFDLGIRVVKLVYFQLIAPVAVICRILPNAKAKEVFKNWLKLTIQTFMEVFIRVFIMYVGVYFISLVAERGPDILAAALNAGLKPLHALFAEAFIVMGIIAFIRQAPKLIQDVFGFDTGGIKLGFKGLQERASAGGLYAGAGLAGGFATGAIRNLSHNWDKVKNAKGGKAKAKAILRTARGVAAGGVSAGARSAWNNINAKSFKEAREGTTKGVNSMVASRSKKEAYKASHPGKFGVVTGKVADAVDSVKTWSGFGGAGLEALQQEQALYAEGMAFKKDLFELVADDALVAAYQGSKEAAQKKDYAAGYHIDPDTSKVVDENGVTVKDAQGHAFQSLNAAIAAANYRKAQDIEMYDDAIKLASMRAIHEKTESGDQRFLAQFEKYKRWRERNADNPAISGMPDLRDITSAEASDLDNALRSGSASNISKAKKNLEGAPGSVLAVDTKFKKESARVGNLIAQRRQEAAAKGDSSKGK